MIRRPDVWAAAALVGLLPTHVHALDLSVLVGYGANYTDNTQLTPNDEVAEWIQTPRAIVALDHDGPSLSVALDYDVSRDIHQRDVFTNQTTTEGSALATWRAIADRLSFDLANTSTQSTVDSRDANIQSNRQEIVETTAGTSLKVDGFSDHLIDLRYEYSFYTAQSTDTDNESQTVTGAYIIPISLSRRVQLNAAVSDVNYDSSQNPDYVSQSGNLQYVSEGDQLELDTSIGYTVFDRKQQADDVSATTGDFNIVWHTSDVSSLNASYSRSLQDASSDVTAGIPDFGEVPNGNTNTTAPYTLEATALGITTRLGHNTVDLSGYVNDQDYDGAQQDEHTTGTSLRISRALRQTLTARVYVNYEHIDFTDQDQKDKDFRTGLQLEWLSSRDLSVSLGTTYQKRTSDAAGEGYEEWAGSISFLYALVGSRKPR